MWLREENADTLKGLQPDHVLHHCLSRAREMDRAWGKRKAEKRKETLSLLKREVTTMQLLLESNPQDLQS